MGKPTRQSGLEPGQLVRIPIGEFGHTYGRLLAAQPYLAVYDCRAEDGDPAGIEIVQHPVLFVTGAVFESPIKEGRWTPLDVVPLEEFDVEIPPFYHRAVGDQGRLTIIEAGGYPRPATEAECAGLERSRIWMDEALEDRIIDHYRAQE